jgi:hypothetical protein
MLYRPPLPPPPIQETVIFEPSVKTPAQEVPDVINTYAIKSNYYLMVLELVFRLLTRLIYHISIQYQRFDEV